MKPFRQSLKAWAALAAGIAIVTCAHAQDFPNRPVRMIVPFPAGGTLDGPARLLASAMSRLSGHQFIVENKTGAGGTIASGDVARSPADGYTLLVSSSALPISQVVYSKVPFDALDGFRHVAMFATLPTVIAVNPDKVAARSLAELVMHAKSNPGKLTYASPGTGTGAHFAAELLKDHFGLFIVHVPYRGAAPAVTDAIGGQVDMVVAGQSSLLQHVAAGKLRALAVSSASRVSQMPDVPTVSETKQGYESLTWIGVSAPAKTPDLVAARLAALVREALNDPSTRKGLADAGVTPAFLDERKSTEHIANELRRFGAVARKSGIRAD